MKPLEIIGSWWLPKKPEIKIGGILKFEQPNWPRLELIGAFESTFGKPQKEHDVILGLSKDGKIITLTDCYETARTFASVGVETTEYNSLYVYIGQHFPSTSDITFSNARLDFQGLFEWIGQSAVSQEFKEVPNRLVELKHELPKEIEFATNSATYSCVFGAGTDHDGNVHTLSETRWIEIKVKRKRSRQSFLIDLVQPFQHFLSLGTGTASFIEEFNFEGTEPRTRVDVYFAQRSYVAQIEKNARRDMLFGLSDVYERRQKVLKQWFTAAEKMREVRMLFNDVVRTPDMFLHHKFLSIMQGLETYHSRRMVNEIVPKVEHRARIRKILRACPSEKDWLSERLASSNSKTLRLRLIDLMNRYEKLLTPLITDFDWFNQKVRDTRNYYTHYNPSFRDRALDGASLHWNVERLLILLKACLLKDIGLSLGQIQEVFLEYPVYTHLRSIADYHNSD